jgi:hypothetical protein
MKSPAPLTEDAAMSQTSRRTLVGTVMLIIGLGLLEMALNRAPVDRPVDVSAPAGDTTSPWPEYVDAHGRVLRVDARSAVPASVAELSSR